MGSPQTLGGKAYGINHSAYGTLETFLTMRFRGCCSQVLTRLCHVSVTLPATGFVEIPIQKLRTQAHGPQL